MSQWIAFNTAVHATSKPTAAPAVGVATATSEEVSVSADNTALPWQAQWQQVQAGVDAMPAAWLASGEIASEEESAPHTADAVDALLPVQHAWDAGAAMLPPSQPVLWLPATREPGPLADAVAPSTDDAMGSLAGSSAVAARTVGGNALTDHFNTGSHALLAADVAADQVHVHTSSQSLPTSTSPAAARVATAAVPAHQGMQPLVQALGERIHWQQAQGTDVATVRLDPPDMGSLEIRIRQDGAAVQVHIQATHSEVGRQLAAVVDSLRQELLQRSSDAQVTVAAARTPGHGAQGEGQRQHSTPFEDNPDGAIGQALQAWDGVVLT